MSPIDLPLSSWIRGILQGLRVMIFLGQVAERLLSLLGGSLEQAGEIHE